LQAVAVTAPYAALAIPNEITGRIQSPDRHPAGTQNGLIWNGVVKQRRLKPARADSAIRRFVE
jgi:hypothetical protein